MQLFNTRGHQLRQFTPLRPDSVRMYSCGPTVYNHAHIGNLRLTGQIPRPTAEAGSSTFDKSLSADLS